MKQVELLQKLKRLEKPFFTFAELQLILGLSKLSTNKRIIDLVNQGFLLKLSKNIYTPSFWKYDVTDIANYLYQPAYLSFESALSNYNIITSHDKDIITFATIQNHHERQIDNKTVVWSKIKPELFFGFKNLNNIMIATPEKALADLIYMASFGKGDLNKEELAWEKIKDHTLEEILKKFPVQTQRWAERLMN